MKRILKYISLVLIFAVVLSLCAVGGFYLFKTYQLNEFKKSVPAAGEVEYMSVNYGTDDSILFMGTKGYSIAVLSENTKPQSFISTTQFGKVLDAVIMPADTKEFQSVVRSLISNGYIIKTLYVPRDTSAFFISEVEQAAVVSEQTDYFNCVPIYGNGFEYDLVGECAIYFLRGSRDGLSVTLQHGDVTVICSPKRSVSALFKPHTATISFVPYNLLLESNVATDFALFDASEPDVSVLGEKTLNFYPSLLERGASILSDGSAPMFDVTFKK